LSIREEQAKKADGVVSGAKKGATISLGFLGFGSQNDENDVASEAPRGMPTINKWRRNRDGSVTGLISGSKAFEEGESVTTSPLTSDPIEGSIVTTVSGSKYFLKSKSGGFSFLSGGVSPAEKSDTTAVQQSVVDEKKAAQLAAAQARQLENEKRKAAQKAAAEERKAARQAVIDAKKAAEDAAKRAKSEEVARKKAASAAAVKQNTEMEEILTNAKPRATISLDFFGFGQSAEDKTPVAITSKSRPKIVSKAPRGVPTFSNWKSNRDGSITGFISGSSAYDDGKIVTTSPLTTAAAEGALVQTTSGSRYFLAPKGSKQQTAAEERKAAQQAAVEAKRIAAEERKAAQQAAVEAKRIAAEERKAAQQAAVEAKRIAAEERKAAQQATEKAKRLAAEAAKKAKSEESTKKMAGAAEASRVQKSKSQSQNALSKASSGSTISLGFLNFGSSSDESSSSVSTNASQRKSTILSKAPKGVPTLSKWRQNRDGSITGLISGSGAFSDGESITTSPIVTGVADGSLVQTSSGSKYFLAPKIGKDAPKTATQSAAPVRQKRVPPPRGVPKLIKWRKNRDDSITGFISGSPNFDEGEKITTSPITSGSIEEGQVVRTGSGSSYYLV
jgi:flagellar biosynthesis GTPase FlhF